MIVLSDLSPNGLERVLTTVRGLDPAARFTFLELLISTEEEHPLLDFSTLCLACLDDPDASVRALAITGLASYTGRDAIQPLASIAGRDSDPSARSEAALALGAYALQAELGEIGSHDRAVLVDRLRQLATDVSEDPVVQASALTAVAVISEPWIQDLIFDAYESGDEALRLGALQAMGRTADEYWLPTLTNAMAAVDEDERMAAALAAGEIGSEDGIVSLAELLDDESSEVAQTAAQALGMLGGTVAVELLQPYSTHPDSDVREAVQAALAEAAFNEDPIGAVPPGLFGSERS